MSPQTQEGRNQLELEVPVLAPLGREVEMTCAIMRREGIACLACGSTAELIERVRKGSGPPIVAEEALETDEVAALGSALSDQPSWSDLPLILLSSSQGRNTGIHALRSRRSTTVLRRPIDSVTFLGVISSALEARRRQYEVRDLLGYMHKLNQRLELRANQLRELAAQLTEAERRERARVAQVLHDELQQLLVASRMGLGRLQAQSDRDAEVRSAVSHVDGLLVEAIRASRSLSRELSPPIMQQGSLSAALEWLAKETTEKHGLEVEVDLDERIDEVDEPVRVFLFEAARELLLNVVKHAKTDKAWIEARAEKGRLRLAVVDRGCGFDSSRLHGDELAHAGLGLFAIKERIALLEGRLEIESVLGHGCRVTLHTPLGQTNRQGLKLDLATRAKPFRHGGPQLKLAVERVRVLVADDHQVVRQGIVSLLENEPDITVVGEASDGEETVREAVRLQPDVVIVDVAMPRMNGVEATRRLRAQMPHVQVIGLSMFEEDEVADLMLNAGASAYLVKSGPSEELLAAIRAFRSFPGNAPVRE